MTHSSLEFHNSFLLECPLIAMKESPQIVLISSKIYTKKGIVLIFCASWNGDNAPTTRAAAVGVAWRAVVTARARWPIAMKKFV